MRAAGRRSNSRRSWILISVATLAAVAVALTSRELPNRNVDAQTREPFLAPASPVVASDRLVCSLLDGAASQTNITGQDGGVSVRAGDTVYWSFNDTWVSGNDGRTYLIPNNLASATDTDASDCVDMAHLAKDGWAQPLLGRQAVPGAVNGIEAGIFPSSLIAVEPGYVHFFYVSAETDPTEGYRLRGIGLGKFDTATLAAQRLLDGEFLWAPGQEGAFRVTDVTGTVDGAYVYVFLQVQLADSQMGVLLGRIAIDEFESARYQYWDGSDWLDTLPDVSSPAVANAALLWQQPIGTNAPSVSYNPFLGKWLAVFAGGFAERIDARVAGQITGPWLQFPAATAIDCLDFLPLQQRGFICYLGHQHPEYMADGGRTIYVTYSNQDSYQVYLHEVRLAAPVIEFTNPQGEAAYVPNKELGPRGFVAQGQAFYASDIAVPGFSAIHRWDGGDGSIRYSPSSPGASFADGGIAFYAPATITAVDATNALYAPVYRWTRSGTQRYSPLNLSGAGYTRNELTFFAPCPDTDGDGIDDCSATFPRCADYTGDRLVTVADLGYVVAHYRQRKPSGNLYSVADVSEVVRTFRQNCPN